MDTLTFLCSAMENFFFFINIMSDIKDVIIIEVYQAIIGMNHIKGASSDSNSFKIMKK